jgi:type VI secretion system secreted protein VgrG
MRKLEAVEGISQLFTFEAEVLHEEGKERMKTTVVKPDQILGKPVSIIINQKEGEYRHFNGVVNRISQGSRTEKFSLYKLTIVPHVWILTRTFRAGSFRTNLFRTSLKRFWKIFLL